MRAGVRRDAPAVGLRIVRSFARLLVAVFYPRVEVVGLERVPPGGPLIVAANHQNALVDPLFRRARLGPRGRGRIVRRVWRSASCWWRR